MANCGDRREWGNLVLLWLLLFGTIATSEAVMRWQCSGELSTYTYTDCQNEKWNTNGCYYQQHFNQFQTCSSLCDGVRYGSIDEERCAAFCKEYLLISCKLQDQTTSAPLSHMTTSQGQITRSAVIREPVMTASSTALIVMSTLAAVVIVAMVALVAFCLQRIKKPRREKHIQQVKVMQPTDEMYVEIEPLASHSVMMPSDIQDNLKEGKTEKQSGVVHLA